MDTLPSLVRSQKATEKLYQVCRSGHGPKQFMSTSVATWAVFLCFRENRKGPYGEEGLETHPCIQHSIHPTQTAAL